MLQAALDTAPRLLQLAIPAFLGALAGRGGLFRDPEEAINALNTYALNIGFPALIALGLVDAQLDLPSSPLFYLAWPICLFAMLTTLWFIPWQQIRESLGTLSLVVVFGNVAYLGLPYVRATFGEQIGGAAALAVAIHVTGAVTLGPTVLALWAGGQEKPTTRQLVARVAKQPLFWAPIVGLVMRALPGAARDTASAWLGPIAASAAPVALFLLGLYLYQQRDRLAARDLPLLGHLLVRQFVTPLSMLALMVVGWNLGWVSGEHAALHVVLASMPVAITTFSMAHQAGARSDRVGAAIVWSSILSLLLLPLWSSVAKAIFEQAP